MKIIIHRGSKQIGGTCIEFWSERSRLIFDIGEELPDINNLTKKQTPLIVDDLFLNSKRTAREIDGVFITHNHGDHIGLLENVRDSIPIFIGKVAAEIHNTICDFTSKNKKILTETFLEHDKPIIIKDFKVTPFLVDHSAYDSYAFLIEFADKKIIYTGDFRRHGTKGIFTDDLARNVVAHRPDILLIEGTNLYKDDYIAETENEVGAKAESFMQKTKGNVFVLQSSANIDRLENILEACNKANRILVVDIFTAHILAKIHEDKFNNIKIFYPYWLTKRMFESKEGEYFMKLFVKRKLPTDELRNRRDLCILVRENMVSDIIKRINYEEAGLIYSKWERYKEEQKTKRFVDFFESRNLTSISLHTSGHADVQTIKDFVQQLDPVKIIPVHTETPEKYKELFNEQAELVDDESEILL